MTMPSKLCLAFVAFMSIALVSCSGQEANTTTTPSTTTPTATIEVKQMILDVEGDYVQSVTFSPDGQSLAVASWHPDFDREFVGAIRIYDVSTGELLEEHRFVEQVLSVSFSPDGRWLAAGLVAVSEIEEGIAIWDLSQESTPARLQGNGSWVDDVVFSPDSRLLASVGEDAEVKLWDISTRELVATFDGHTDIVTTVSFSPDGRLVASGSDDGRVMIWDVNRSELLKTLDGNAFDVFDLAFSPDGRFVATAVLDGIQLWEMDSGRILWARESDAYANSVAFSPNGQFLAAGLEDGTVQIFELPSEALITTLRGHGVMAMSVEFSPAGERLASGAEDGKVILWPADEFHAGVVSPPALPATTTASIKVDPTSTPMVSRATSTPERVSNVRIDAFGVPMLPIPAGTYSVGGSPEQSLENCLKYREDCLLEWFEDESPLHQVQLEEFMIDQFEVTNARYAECVDAGVCDPPDLVSSATRDFYYGSPVYDAYPAIYASWEDANTYCNWRGARLPTEAEWETAARGGLDPYPWGKNEPVCSPGSPYGAKFDDEDECNDTDTEAVGTFRPNAYGLFDMAGNVMEWTADWYDAYPGGSPSGEYGETYRVARGGSWYTFGYVLRAHIRIPAVPSASFDHYGIRCASEPFESFGPVSPSTGAGQQGVSPEQELLKDEWRPAISNAILLSTTCQLMFETHFYYAEGELDLEQAITQLNAEGDFVAFAVRGFSSGPVPSGDVAPYMLDLEGQSRNMIDLLPPLDHSLIGSTQALDTLGNTCGVLSDLLNGIIDASKAAGLTETSVEQIDQEMTPMINDLFDMVLEGA